MKSILVTGLILSCIVSRAQSLEEGKKQLYYEKYQSANTTFHAVIKQNPDNGEAWFNLVKSYVLLQNDKKAVDTLLSAPASVKNDPYFRIATGLTLLQQNKKEEAAGYFNNVLEEKKKKNEDFIAAIAWVENNSPNGDVAYTIDLLNKAIKKSKHDPELYILLGDAWRKQSNGTEAFKAYQEAINQNKDYAAAYYRMGQIFLTQKNSGIYTEYFQKAIAADPNYAPALYSLYIYEFNRDPAKSMEYYKKYMANADHSIQTEYDVADLLYLNKQYDAAIEKARSIIGTENNNAKPRLYKLISYSYAGKADTAKAITAMEKYFANEEDSNVIAKDYESMSAYYRSMPGQDSLAGVYLARATELEKDSTVLFDYYKQLADIAKQRKDYEGQAKWLGKYCTGNSKTSNLDLFYWGIAHYRTENYSMADSVFGIYINKYPDQSFGYYWQAKSKALEDKDMEAGLAIPVYEKLIEVLQKDTTDTNYKKWLVEAYSYLAAYEVNSKKDYTQAISYFEKALEVDPENETAKKYVDMLEKRSKDNSADTNSSSSSSN